jgi:hypothetical protein
VERKIPKIVPFLSCTHFTQTKKVQLTRYHSALEKGIWEITNVKMIRPKIIQGKISHILVLPPPPSTF